MEADAMTGDARPMVAHVLFRFDVGGLENGVVNLINRMPANAYRHVVIALADVTDFRLRLSKPDVICFALGKRPGTGLKLLPRMWRLLRELKPAIVHTRNLAALEMQPAAWAAGVPVRIHGEHGRDVDDLDGSNTALQRVRRRYAPFVHHYVALSEDLRRYLAGPVGVAPNRIDHICNGVDSQCFALPQSGARDSIPGCPFTGAEQFIFGTVGRMQGVKDQTLLARAFVRVLEQHPALRPVLRLAMVGDGPLRAEAMAILHSGGVADLAWLPGERKDVADVMRGLDAFVLPSLAEGISNTILEAMATGLPVLATAVGGNPELVGPGVTGDLVPAGDVQALADGLARLVADRERSRALGRAGRLEVERRFSLDAMVASYQGMYDQLLAAAGYEPRKN
jgi:sugar transferase (PEP-CTERM/EpsH1 system associated)